MAEDVTPDVVPALVAQHDRFLRFLEPRVGSREAAEEVLQAAFVKAIERGGELREGERATAWFYRLLRNALIDHYRHRDAERRALARHAGEVSLTAEDDATLEHTVCQCVYALIPTLKPEYAGILKAVEVDEAPVAVVAAQLGVTPGNAAVRLSRAAGAEIAPGDGVRHLHGARVPRLLLRESPTLTNGYPQLNSPRARPSASVNPATGGA